MGAPAMHAPFALHEPWWSRRREELLALARGRTPLFVLDGATIDAAAAQLGRLGSIARILYAVKANAHAGLLARLAAQGLGFECVSPGEIVRVIESVPDIAGERLLFTPNFAACGEYAAAFECGVRVTLDDLRPLELAPDLFRGRDLFVRLDPGLPHGHHEHVRTAGPRSKFGIAAPELGRFASRARELDARIVGLHAHVGSGILDPRAWIETARFLADSACRFPECRVLDLGGGLGVREHPEDEPLDLGALASGLSEVRMAHPRQELWLEPGRFLVAEAGVLLATVTQVKEKQATRFVGVDAGMHVLARPMLYGSWHAIANLSRLHEAPSETCDIVGQICEAGDVLGRERLLPPTREGDVLLVATTGAYGSAMSSRYNLRRAADEVLLADAPPPAE